MEREGRVLDSPKNLRELYSLEYSTSMLLSYPEVKQKIIVLGLGQTKRLPLLKVAMCQDKHGEPGVQDLLM